MKSRSLCEQFALFAALGNISNSLTNMTQLIISKCNHIKYEKY